MDTLGPIDPPWPPSVPHWSPLDTHGPMDALGLLIPPWIPMDTIGPIDPLGPPWSLLVPLGSPSVILGPPWSPWGLGPFGSHWSPLDTHGYPWSH